MKTIKRIAAFVLAISFCFVLMLSPGAHAVGLLGGQQFGAWIAAGLVSLNIVANTALQSQPVQDLWNWCSAPSAEDRINYLFPNTGQIITDYMNAATIKIDQGVTTIDGVQYDEVFVDPGTFTTGLKSNLFDFKTKWNILSGQNDITLAKGVGTLNNFPVYNASGQLTTQTITIGGAPATGTSYGNTIFSVLSGNSVNVGYRTATSSYGNWYAGPKDSGSYGFRIYKEGNNWLAQTFPQQTNRYYTNGTYIDEPFEYKYVSGIVPAEQTDIPSDYGLSIKIPHDQLQTFYNSYPQYNVDNSVINIQQDQIDIDQLTQAIFDQIQSMDDIKAEWTSGEEPEPPAPKDPVENIDENVQSINQYQQNINQQVDHMHQDVEAIHQTQQQMQQTQQQMQQDTSSIDTTLKDVTATPSESDLPSFKFDLRELFPFCIPFDIYRLLSSFDATPQAPHVQLPIVIQSIGFNYTLDLDFSSWDPVAQAMRTAELIVYAIGLAWATGKVIKW